jgi:hypothetical protein
LLLLHLEELEIQAKYAFSPASVTNFDTAPLLNYLQASSSLPRGMKFHSLLLLPYHLLQKALL